MDNEEKNYDNGGWQSSEQSETFQSPSQTSNGNGYVEPQNGNGSYDQSQSSQGYYSQPQNGSNIYNQQQNGDYYSQQNAGQNYYNSQPGDDFQQTSDSFRSVNNQGYNNYVPEPDEGPGYAIAGMVCGILSIVLCCCQYYLSGILAIIGLVFSIIVLKNRKPGKGMAIAGVICSAIGLVIALCLIATRIYMLTHPEQMNNMMELYRQNLYNQLN